jgi:Sulfotransferase family
MDSMKEECEPIFIVGSARSGTSAIVLALRNGANIAGYNEGHYASVLHKLIRTASDHIIEQRQKDRSPEVMMFHVKVDEFTHDIMEMVKRKMEAHFPDKKVWMDKTPDGLMLRIIPYLMVMWPKARFIYCKRRAIENLSSRLRKFTHLTFERNCEHWEAAMSLWLKHRQYIPENQRIEIDQYEMGVHPTETAERLATFLNLNEDQRVKIEKIFKGDRPEFTGADEQKLKGLHDLGWSEEQLEIYNRICAPVNKEYGYSEDSSYYLNISK